MKNVVAYCRVSTDGQTGEDKFGIDNQKSIIMNYAAAHDMQISQWYIDEGASGVKESRPAMDALLFGDQSQSPTNPPVQAVIVAKSDRIARDIKLYFYYMMVLERKKIQLISATEEIVNDDTGLGNVYRSLMLFVAEQERKNIMKRTTGGRTIKASRGGYSGGQPPYGYMASNHKLIVVPEEAEVVRLIFAQRDQKITLRQTISYLKENGYKSRSGGDFALATLSGILNNENLYRGLYKYGNEKWIKGEHEAILENKEEE